MGSTSTRVPAELRLQRQRRVPTKLGLQEVAQGRCSEKQRGRNSAAPCKEKASDLEPVLTIQAGLIPFSLFIGQFESRIAFEPALLNACVHLLVKVLSSDHVVAFSQIIFGHARRLCKVANDMVQCF